MADISSGAGPHVQHAHSRRNARLPHHPLQPRADVRAPQRIPLRRKAVEELPLRADAGAHVRYPEMRPSLSRTMMPPRFRGYHHPGATGSKRSSDVKTSTGPEGPTLHTPHFTGD